MWTNNPSDGLQLDYAYFVEVHANKGCHAGMEVVSIHTGNQLASILEV